jgi:hypothetical protein
MTDYLHRVTYKDAIPYTPLKISNGTNTTVYLSKLDETKSMYILDCLTNKL